MVKSGFPRHSKQPPQVTIEHEPESPEIADEQPLDDIARPEPEVTEAGVKDLPDPEQMSATPKSGGGANLLSGLAGGALALLGAAGLQWGGVLPSLGTNSEIAVLKRQVTTLLEAPAPPSVDSIIIEGLKAAQTGFQSTLESMSGELTTVTTATRQLGEELKTLKSSGAAGDAAAVSAFTDKLAALESQIANLKPADNSAQLAALEEKIASLGQGGGAANVAQAIAAAGLKAAIDRGGAFANELETYATVAPQSPELDQLKNLAAAGVPSKSELGASFGNIANSIIAASRSSDPDAGFFQRLGDSAKSLIRSRPVGAIEGDSVEAVVARMEVAINRGDLDAAMLEAAKLPDEARAAGSDFLTQLAARRDVDLLVSKALTSALSASGAGK